MPIDEIDHISNYDQLYIHQEEEATRYAEPEFTVADVIVKKTRLGKYINLSKLDQLDFSKEIPPIWQNTQVRRERWVQRAEHLRQIYREDVVSFGHQSLAHLGLTVEEFMMLDENGVTGIQQLATALREGTLQQHHSNELRVCTLYAQWTKVSRPTEEGSGD